MAKIKKRNHRKLPKLDSLSPNDQEALEKHFRLVFEEVREDLNALNQAQTGTVK